jgi:uncharacterized membrane protein
MSHTPATDERASQRSALPPLLPIEPDQPLAWLVLGFRDITRNPLLSLAHGLVVFLACTLIACLSFDRFWLLVSLLSGGMVVAPVLATSLYTMSRAIERGEPVNRALLMATWTRWNLRLRAEPESYWSLVNFGVLLGLAAAGWVATSSALITLMAPVAIHTPMDFLRHVVASQDHRLFEIWMALGGLMLVPMFASSVVTAPLLLDRRVTVLQAVLTSWKTVLAYPVTMALWAFLLMLFCMLGLFSLFLGMVLVVPMLGHASWHAYRALVDVDDLPPRLSEEGQG